MTLQELITQTRAHANSIEPLTLLASAAQRQQELAALGEQLLDHFVQQARTAECSWSQIGSALGVSKQGAQQRYAGAVHSLLGKLVAEVKAFTGAPFKRFTDRARRAVMLAQEEARGLHHDHLGAEHLLLGLLAEGKGIGARALTGAGITLEAARAGVEQITCRGEKMPSGHIQFTSGAKKVLELALCEALELDHHYIGTEHLLLGLLREDDNPGMPILLEAGVPADQLRDSVLALLMTSSSPA